MYSWGPIYTVRKRKKQEKKTKEKWQTLKKLCFRFLSVWMSLNPHVQIYKFFSSCYDLFCISREMYLFIFISNGILHCIIYRDFTAGSLLGRNWLTHTWSMWPCIWNRSKNRQCQSSLPIYLLEIHLHKESERRWKNPGMRQCTK